MSDFNWPILWNTMAKLQVTVAEAIPYFQDADTRVLLQWVLESIRDMSTQAWIDGPEHELPSSATSYMESMIAKRKEELAIHDVHKLWDHPDLWRMGYLRTQLKEVEIYYRRWSVNIASVDESISVATADVAAFLCTLGAYVACSMEYENHLRGGTVKVWQGCIQPFPLS